MLLSHIPGLRPMTCYQIVRAFRGPPALDPVLRTREDLPVLRKPCKFLQPSAARKRVLDSAFGKIKLMAQREEEKLRLRRDGC